ncbi:MAG: hypothetical protein V7L23_07240 [Nostoc sp.]
MGHWAWGIGHEVLGAKGKDLQQLPLCSSTPLLLCSSAPPIPSP